MTATPFWKAPGYDEAFAAELQRREARKREIAYRFIAPQQLREVLPLLAELRPANASAQLGAIKRILAARGTNLAALAQRIKHEQFPDEPVYMAARGALDFLAELGCAERAGARKEATLALQAVLALHSRSSISRFAEALSGWNEGTISMLEQELRKADEAVLDLLHNGLESKEEEAGQ